MQPSPSDASVFADTENSQSVPRAILDWGSQGLREILPAQLAGDRINAVSKLLLSRNRLARLPPEFARFQSLRILLLMDNDFDDIPRVLEALPSLHKLGLSGNPLCALGTHGTVLAAVDTLCLSLSRAPMLPPSVLAMQSLEALVFHHAAITAVPSGIDRLRHLRVLDLSHNSLKAVPHEVLTV